MEVKLKLPPELARWLDEESKGDPKKAVKILECLLVTIWRCRNHYINCPAVRLLKKAIGNGCDAITLAKALAKAHLD